ncbi:MAG: ABC transporter permease [Candidatus Diapherotrites archaeon]|nr:ABC transporter permease [Candidatus Diapherotrites archaeon]
MLKIAYENLTRNKARTALSVMALVIGVVAIITMVSVSDGIRNSMVEAISGMNGIIVWEKDALDLPFSCLPMSYEKKLEAIPGVKVVFPEVYGLVNTIEGEKPKGGSMTMGMAVLAGFDPVKEQQRVGSIYGVEVEKGRNLQPGDKYVAVIGHQLADEYDKRVGSIMKVNGKRFKVIGILEESQYAGSAVVVPIDIARELAGLDSDTVNSFTVQTYNPSDQEGVSKIIEARLDDVDAMSTQAMLKDLEEVMVIFDWAFILLSSISLLIAGIGIINTMLMSVMDRQKEIGVLKAVGWSSEDVLKLVLYESALIGVFGGLLGCIAGGLVVIGIENVVEFGLTLSWTTILGAFAFAVFAGLVGGVYPAWKISRIDPIQAIRME